MDLDSFLNNRNQGKRQGKVKVLLINPPMDVQGGPPKFVSFGIAYIAQRLRSCGYGIEILDIDAYRFSKEEVSRMLKEKKFDVAGIGGLATVYPYLVWLVPEIKKWKPDVEIILGGAVASSLKERCFERCGIDYAVIGEGEETIVELLEEIKGRRNFSSVKGIGFKDKGSVVFTQSRSLMSSLADVPMFDDSLFPVEMLLKNSGGIMQIHTQRGCPFACTFCFNCYRVVGREVRYRPVGKVLDEIEVFNRKYDVRLFALAGELILMNKAWVIEFCRELLARRLRISYRVTSNVNTIDEESLSWLKRTGCVSMSIGIESGSPKILRIMKKGITVERARNAVQLAKRYIPNLEISMMVNFIGETKQTLRESVGFFKEINVKPLIFFATPFPGTELYRMAIARGCIKDEEEYLMNLDKVSISKPSLNLTDMSNEEAERELAWAVDEIERYYFRKSLLSVKAYNMLLLKMRKDGLRNTAKTLAEKMRRIF